MPSGRTHDRITLWSLPLVAGLTLGLTRSSHLTLIVAGSFLVGGLMLGPDLDIYSRQYQRWGWLRWIWLPYRKVLRHRSFWSHGFLVGTTLRLLYLGVWLLLLVGIGGAIAYHGWHLQPDWQQLPRLQQTLQSWVTEGFALFIGLELGAMSHALSDWLASTHKRIQRQGWQTVFSSSSHKTTQRKRKPHKRPSPARRMD